jgi:pectinesterase
VKTKLILVFIILTILFSINGLGQDSPLYIKAKNPSNFNRNSETIVLNWDLLKKNAPWLDSSKIVVIDSKDNKLITQSIGNEFLFQSDFNPKETKTFIIYNDSSANRTHESLTDVKFILPRQDVTWENDRIAHRIYGSPLAGDVLSGVDVWVKRVRYLIMDKWYAGNALEGKEKVSYHVDHGEGADFFTVGRSLGAGGCAIWKDSLFHQTGLFKSHEIIASGPIRAKFTVWYDGDSINGKPFKEKKTYTLDAGQNMTKINVSYYDLQEKGKILIAAGLVKRKNTTRYSDSKQGWLSLWGDVNDDSANGLLGIGVIIPNKSFKSFGEDSSHYLIIGKTDTNKQLTYYTGAGWTRSEDFNGIDDWNNYLKSFALRLQSPLKISISRKK